MMSDFKGKSRGSKMIHKRLDFIRYKMDIRGEARGSKIIPTNQTSFLDVLTLFCCQNLKIRLLKVDTNVTYE